MSIQNVGIFRVTSAKRVWSIVIRIHPFVGTVGPMQLGPVCVGSVIIFLRATADMARRWQCSAREIAQGVGGSNCCSFAEGFRAHIREA